MPDVGDENTPWDDVSKFYDFWYACTTKQTRLRVSQAPLGQVMQRIPAYQLHVSRHGAYSVANATYAVKRYCAGIRCVFRFTFKSWREFPHPDEEDVECAESREHRRWIER